MFKLLCFIGLLSVSFSTGYKSNAGNGGVYYAGVSDGGVSHAAISGYENGFNRDGASYSAGSHGRVGYGERRWSSGSGDYPLRCYGNVNIL